MPGIVRWPARIAPGRVSDEVVSSIDLLPTLAACCAVPVPTDRTIDGRDISAVLFGATAPALDVAFYYYWMNDLEAVRVGRWKLHFAKRGIEAGALYDLDADIGETTDLAEEHPDVVIELADRAEWARRSLGDARLDRIGDDLRPIGRVDVPARLTTFDAEHPYYMAEYDLSDRG